MFLWNLSILKLSGIYLLKFFIASSLISIYFFNSSTSFFSKFCFMICAFSESYGLWKNVFFLTIDWNMFLTLDFEDYKIWFFCGVFSYKTLLDESLSIVLIKAALNIPLQNNLINSSYEIISCFFSKFNPPIYYWINFIAAYLS